MVNPEIGYLNPLLIKMNLQTVTTYRFFIQTKRIVLSKCNLPGGLEIILMIVVKIYVNVDVSSAVQKLHSLLAEG